jgi:UDP-N-acetylmuramate dehydrogenase
MNLEHNVPLAPFTTFELGGPARAMCTVASEDDLRAAIALKMPMFILGGGSNLVVADRGFDGLVVRIASRGIRMRDDVVEVEAGEPWDPFVANMVDAGLTGVECLSGIPGSVGATPIQNVGAYGQEVAQTIVRVRSIDVATGEVRERTPDECGFRYRHSAFKTFNEVVTRVTFQLSRSAPVLRYPELQRAMSGEPTLREVRDTVIKLRRSKSMVIDEGDPNRRSAGSFFTNPIVPVAKGDEIASSFPDVPRFPGEDSGVKLSAGWLIERAGMVKGTRRGNVGISSKHALALVHHGGGSALELVALAREVVAAVEAAFGVTLRPEPVLLGFTSDETRGVLP